MLKLKYILGLLVIVISFTSCNIRRPDKTGFMFKEAVGNINALDLNGGYVSKYSDSLFQIYFFKKNGTYLQVVVNDTTCPLKINKSEDYFNKYGLYKVRDNKLVLQEWSRNNNEFLNVWVSEYEVLIKEKKLYWKTFKSYKSYFFDSIKTSNSVLKKIKCRDDSLFTKRKPWFVKRKWYLKNRHPSRK